MNILDLIIAHNPRFLTKNLTEDFTIITNTTNGFEVILRFF